MTDITSTLRTQAQQIADRGIPGWGNTMTDAANEIERLRAAAGTPAQGQPIPAGWRLVPVDPTPEMVVAAWGTACEDADPADPGTIAAWSRMLAAAPATHQPALQVAHASEDQYTTTTRAPAGSADSTCNETTSVSSTVSAASRSVIASSASMIDSDVTSMCSSDRGMVSPGGVQAILPQAAQPAAAVQRERLIEIIADALDGTWHCNRVWSAWGVGTMSQDDFSPVSESDTPADVADAVLTLLASDLPAQGSGS